MASSIADPPSTTTPAQSAPQQTGSRPGSGHGELSSSPVEMRTLPASATAPTLPSTEPTAQTSESAANPPSAQEQTSQPQEVQPLESTPIPTESMSPSASLKPTPPTDLTRSETEAIGPSSDTPATKPDNSNGPVVVITLLLTTGARHPYKIDEKYLKKRNVNVEAMDPYNISVYTLKELIWRDWREGTFRLVVVSPCIYNTAG